MRRMKHSRMLLWSIQFTRGFDTAWATIEQGRLRAHGRACALVPFPYWVAYTLETDDSYVTSRLAVETRWQDGSAAIDLRRREERWHLDGDARPDLDDALDCDLMACPLTNTMPILRHDLHRGAGDHMFVMAFIEVPKLRVVPLTQRYTHVGVSDDRGIVRYRSDSFQSDLTIDQDGFVIEYPRLGRRIEPDER